MKNRINKTDAENIAQEIAIPKAKELTKFINQSVTELIALRLKKSPKEIRIAYKKFPDYFRESYLNLIERSIAIKAPALANEYSFNCGHDIDYKNIVSRMNEAIKNHDKMVIELKHYILSHKTYKNFQLLELRMYNKIPKELKTEIESTEVVAINYDPLKKYFKD